MIRLAIRVPRAQAEVVLAELLELAPGGVEEVNAGDEVEFAVYGSSGELPSLPDLRAVCDGADLAISTSELPDDWDERWKQFHKPVLIESPAVAGAEGLPGLRIRPPWEPAAAAGSAGDAQQHEIVIDPGQAFGTGGHATTRLCLALMLELPAGGVEPGAMLDVGTGSGVLAIAGGMLGFGPLLGLDHERESVLAAEQNALANGVQLEVRAYDLRTDPLPWLGAGAAPPPAGGPLLLTANLLRPLLLDLLDALSRPPDHLIVGGLLIDELEQVLAAFASKLGMRERARRRGGEWAAGWLSAA